MKLLKVGKCLCVLVLFSLLIKSSSESPLVFHIISNFMITFDYDYMNNNYSCNCYYDLLFVGFILNVSS